MVAVPSGPERTSRAAPVALFTTETLASLIAAPVWSTTLTMSVAVFGDCAASGAAMRINGNSDETSVFIGFSFFGCWRRAEKAAGLDVQAAADEEEVGGGCRLSVGCCRLRVAGCGLCA